MEYFALGMLCGAALWFVGLRLYRLYDQSFDDPDDDFHVCPNTMKLTGDCLCGEC